MRRHYGPGWTMRVYYEVKEDASSSSSFPSSFSSSSPSSSPSEDPMAALCELACSEPDLDLCDASNVPLLGDVTPVYPMVWRFLPTLDPMVS